MIYLTQILITLLALLIACPAMAQNYAGVIGGPNFTNIDVDAPDEDWDHEIRFGIGGVIDWHLYKNLSLRAEPVYMKKGTKQDGVDPELGNVTGKVAMTTVEMPVFLKLDLASGKIHPYLMGGPCISVLLDSELKYETGFGDFKGDADDVLKTVDFGLGFGGGVSVPFGNSSIFVEGRYVLGLKNVNDGGSVNLEGGGLTFENEVGDNDVKTRSFQIMAGVTFPL